MKFSRLAIFLVSLPLMSGACDVVPSALRIVALDVGDGTAVLIQDPSGTSALYLDTSDFARVPERLQALGVSHISLLISSELTPANAGPLRQILNLMEPETFISAPIPPPGPEDTPSLNDLRNTIYNRQKLGLTKYESARAQTYSLGLCVLTVLPVASPPHSISGPNPVVRIQFKDFSMLLPGSSPASAERALMAAFPGPTLRADLLLVSGDAEELPSLTFLRSVGPGLIIASVSGTPSSASPSYALLALSWAAGIPLARTDHLGSLTITSTGNGFRLYDKYGPLSLSFPYHRMPLVLP